MSGGSIQSEDNSNNGYTVYNSEEGNFTITGGTIKSNTEAIRNVGGTIIVGNKNGQINNQNIEIIGNRKGSGYQQYYGITNYGIFKYYDGKITGSYDKGAIFGKIDEIEENTYIKHETSGWYQDVTLERIDYVAQISTNSQNKFGSLKEAIERCPENEESTITILCDFSIIEGQECVIPQNKNIIIDLKGHKITSYCSNDIIENNGILKITDSTVEGTINNEISSKCKGLFNNKGNLTINNVVLRVIPYGSSEYSNHVIVNTGELSIESGHIMSKSYDHYSEVRNIMNLENGTINMSGGAVYTNNGECVGKLYINTRNMVSIYNESTNSITITGGAIYGGKYGIETAGSGEINIEKISISKVYSGIYKHGTGKISITGGNISAYNPINIQVEDLENVQETQITGSASISANIKLEVNSLHYVGNTISNSKNSKILIDLNEGKTISGINGIYNDGEIEIKRGEIVVETPVEYQSKELVGEHGGTELYGIKNNQGGIATIGQIDNQANTRNPLISGKYGIINDGTLNLYDGRIQGDTDKSLYGNSIYGKETGFRVVKYRNGENEHIEVPEGKEITILEEGKEVEVIHQGEETGTGYDSLEEALSVLQDNDTIKLLANVNINESSNSFIMNNNIILDLAGNEMIVKKDNAITINSNGNLEIIDTSANSAGKIVVIKQSIEESNLAQNASATLINNNGTLKLSSGRIEINDDRNIEEENRSIIKNKGNVVLDGMIINCNSNDLIIINNIDNGTFTMSSGDINLNRKLNLNSNLIVINNDGTGKISLNGGKITDNAVDGLGYGYTGYALKNNKSGEVEISNIEINGVGYGFYNKAGDITMTGGNIQNIGYGIENSEGNVSINGGKISAKYNAILNNNGTININGNTEIITNDGRGFIGTATHEYEPRDVTIYNGEGTLSINGKNVKIKSETNTAIQGGILEDSNSNNNQQQRGQINIISGSIEGSNYGIHNLDNNVSLGNEETSLLNISIISENGFGVSNQKNGNLNYYSGTIKGKNSEEYGSIVGSINTIKQNYNVNISVEGTLEVASLVELGNTAQVGERKFNNLEDAIEACNSNDTVTILNNFVITGNEAIRIPQSKDITIDLNGKTITSFVKNSLLVNNGNLIITDNSINGKINLRKDGLITNNGTLEISKIQIVQYAEGSLIYGINPIINNLGTLQLNNETINTHKRYIKAISNKGTVNIQSGIINLQGQYYNTAIENLENGVINIEGGRIELKTGNMSLFYNNYIGQNIGNSTGLWEYNHNGDYIYDSYFTDNYVRKTYNYVIEDSSNGMINITGGEIINSKVYLKNGSTAKLTIDENAYVAKVELENVKQNDENKISKIKGGKVGHIKLTNSNLKIEGGEIGECRYIYPEYRSNSYYVEPNEDGILVFGNSKLEVSGGKIHSKDSNAIELNDISSYINNLYNISQNESDLKNPTVEFTSGEIISDNKSGIYSYAEDAIVTIGKNDNSVSTTSPIITANEYGVYIDKFNFYDGVINGNNAAKNGEANTPENFKIYAENDAKKISLTIIGNFPNAVMLNGSYYKSIKEAIENIGSSSEVTIILAANASIEEPISIPEGKTVIIKLNNFTIENKERIVGNVQYVD